MIVFKWHWLVEFWWIWDSRSSCYLQDAVACVVVEQSSHYSSSTRVICAMRVCFGTYRSDCDSHISQHWPGHHARRRALAQTFSLHPIWITHFRIDRTQQASRGGLITQCLFRCAKLILRCFDVFNAWKFVQIVQLKPKPCLDNTFSQYGIIHCPVEAQFLSPPQASGSVWLPAPFYIAAQVWHLERQEGKILWA